MIAFCNHTVHVAVPTTCYSYIPHVYTSVSLSVHIPLTWAALFVATFEQPFCNIPYTYIIYNYRKLAHLCLDLYKKDRKKERSFALIMTSSELQNQKSLSTNDHFV